MKADGESQVVSRVREAMDAKPRIRAAGAPIAIDVAADGSLALSTKSPMPGRWYATRSASICSNGRCEVSSLSVASTASRRLVVYIPSAYTAYRHQAHFDDAGIERTLTEFSDRHRYFARNSGEGWLRVPRSYVGAATRCRGATVNPAALLPDQRASDAGWSRCRCGRGGGGDFEGFLGRITATRSPQLDAAIK